PDSTRSTSYLSNSGSQAWRMPRSEPLPETDVDSAHWCMNTTIMSTDGSWRASPSVFSSHRVCRLGLPPAVSGTSELFFASCFRPPVYSRVYVVVPFGVLAPVVVVCGAAVGVLITQLV